MENQNKNIQNIKHLNIKLLAMVMSSCVLSAGISSCIYGDNHDGEIKIINDETDSTQNGIYETDSETYASTNYTYTEIEPKSDQYYRSIIADGKVINFVNTPTPTLAPDNNLTDAEIIGEDGIYPEGYFEYMDRKEHSLNFKSIDQMISFYAKVFELKEDVVSKVIYDMLGNNEYPLNQEVTINDTTYTSVEEAIARTTYDLYDNPSSYGYTNEDILSTDGYELDYYYAEELIYKFCDVLYVNKEIALAIVYAESGRKLDSYIFITNHNPGGIVSNGGFAWYKNEACGMFSFVKLLHDKYFVRADDGYNRIKIMSNGYCEDPSYWRNLVGSIYYELCNYGYGSTFYNYRYDGRDLIYCDEEDEESFVKSRFYTN